ncbi:MAG: FixH family protein [Balneolaceae bacterium]
MKCINKILLIPVFVWLAIGMVACDPAGSPGIEEPDLYSVGELREQGVTVQIWSEVPFEVGYNRFYLEVHRAGEPLEDLEIVVVPMMQMEAHAHSAPVENPGPHRTSEESLYQGALIFTMPTMETGSWSLQISVTGPDELNLTGEVSVNVDPSARVRSFESEGGQHFFLTLVEPVEPEVGSNTLLVTLHRQESMMSFPPVTDAEFGFEPWMTAPSMDHGSPNNEPPVHQSAGNYRGIVNFTMTGDWELRFDPVVGGEESPRQLFELTL